MGKKYEYKDAQGEIWHIEKQIEQKPNSRGKVIIYNANKHDGSDRITASRKSILKQMLFDKVGTFEKEKNGCKLTISVPLSVVQLRETYRKRFNLTNERVTKKDIEKWLSSFIIKEL